MIPEAAIEFLRESENRFESSFKRLFHCLDQLDHGQIWWQPNDKMNSVGVLMKHICGNMRQWTITAINNSEDTRNRPQEFVSTSDLTKAELATLANSLKLEFLNSIKNLDASRLMEPKRIQGYDITLMTAIFRALTHLEGHVGQIVLLTRIQLGDRYKIFWTPQTDEQRAEFK